jgi:hypothetical protein
MKQKGKQRQIEEKSKKNDNKKKIKRHIKGNEASTTVFFRNNTTLLKSCQASSTCPENRNMKTRQVRSFGGMILPDPVPPSTTDTTRTGPRSNAVLGHCCLSCGKTLFEVRQ